MSAAHQHGHRHRSGGPYLAVVVVLLLVGVPLAAVLVRAFVLPDGWGLDALRRILGSSRTWRLLAVTIGQAAASTVLALAVGVPVAWVLASLRFRGRSLLRALVTVPFVLPSVVVGAAYATLLGPGGPWDLRGTWWIVLAAHLTFNLAVVVRTVSVAVAALPPGLDESARLLGAGPVDVVRRAVGPAVAPAVGSAGLVVFLYCLTSFGVLVVLGGGAVTTLEVELWVRATRQFDLSGAAVLAGLQFLTVVAALSLHTRAARRTAGRWSSTQDRSRPPATWSDRVAVLLAVTAVGTVAGAPLVALAVGSVRLGGRWSGSAWTRLGSALEGTALAVPPAMAAATTASTADVAATLATVVGVPAARAAAARPGGRAERLLLVPLGVSATTVGLGVLLVAGRPPVDLRGSLVLLVMAQVVVALPLVVRVVAPALAALPPSWSDAAALMGRSARSRWWSVELPAVRAAVVSAVGLALVVCLGEFGATVFVARADRPTLPLVVARLLARPGAAGRGQAMALSCVLALVCAALLVAVDAVGGRAGRRALWW